MTNNRPNRYIYSKEYYEKNKQKISERRKLVRYNKIHNIITITNVRKIKHQKTFRIIYNIIINEEILAVSIV